MKVASVTVKAITLKDWYDWFIDLNWLVAHFHKEVETFYAPVN